jgi:hypothetical protein
MPGSVVHIVAVLVGPTLAAGAARGMSPVPAWLAMSSPSPAPLHAVRVLHGSRRQRRHAPCLAAPGVPLRCVVGGATAPARDRAFAALFPRASVPSLTAGLLMPVAEEGNRHAKPFARRLRARLNAGLGKVGAGPRRLLLARWPRAALPPPAGPPSAGVRAERAGRSAAVCSSWPLPLLRIGLPPPHPCRLRRLGRPHRPASASRALLHPLLAACQAEASAKAGPAFGLCSQTDSPPQAGQFLAASRRLSIPIRARVFSPLLHMCRRRAGCTPDTP